MTACREFGVLPYVGGYLDQPADLMVRWSQYRTIESETRVLRSTLDHTRTLGGSS